MDWPQDQNLPPGCTQAEIDRNSEDGAIEVDDELAIEQAYDALDMDRKLFYYDPTPVGIVGEPDADGLITVKYEFIHSFKYVVPENEPDDEEY